MAKLDDMLRALLAGGPIDGRKAYLLAALMMLAGAAGAQWPEIRAAVETAGLTPGQLFVGGLAVAFLRQGIAKIGKGSK